MNYTLSTVSSATMYNSSSNITTIATTIISTISVQFQQIKIMLQRLQLMKIQQRYLIIQPHIIQLIIAMIMMIMK